MADAADSKSVTRKGVWVQVPPSVPLKQPFKVVFYYKAIGLERSVKKIVQCIIFSEWRESDPAFKICLRAEQVPPSVPRSSTTLNGRAFLLKAQTIF